MATAKKTSSDEAPAKKQASRREPSARASAPRAAAPKRSSGAQIAAEASKQLLTMTGKEAEGISGLRRTEDGWVVQIEVLELSRVPNTTDVLASYEVEMDSDGELQGYRRLRRYVRGVPGEE